MRKWLLVLVIIVIIHFSGCVQSSSSVVQDFKFNSGKGDCGSRNEANIKLENNKISFSGFIGTSNPCYELKASYSIDRVELVGAPTTDVITVTITKNPVGDVCILCEGEVSFNGEITIDREKWESENYGIVIVHEGKELAELYNYVT